MATTTKKTAKKDASAAAASEPKLRIRVRAYEHKILDLSVKQIMDTANRFDAKIVGPVPLPTEIKRWTVNRSASWSSSHCGYGPICRMCGLVINKYS